MKLYSSFGFLKLYVKIELNVYVCVHVHVHTHTGMCWLLSPYLAYFVLNSNYTDAESIC
jgi:hypothetical protein